MDFLGENQYTDNTQTSVNAYTRSSHSHQLQISTKSSQVTILYLIRRTDGKETYKPKRIGGGFTKLHAIIQVNILNDEQMAKKSINPIE
jgi:hypothetical protein